MTKCIGVLTSGGDAPGMNAAIRAVTRSALARGMDVYGIYDGYKGLVSGNFVKLDRSSVSDIMFRGGTFLGTARMPEFREDAVQEIAIKQLSRVGIDSLVAIGGDGTYRGAYSLTKKGINCIGLPGTIDNDCPGTEYTIGFHTALNTIVECVDKLRDTSASHHRCSVVEVMGNHCGDLALYSGLCTGAEIVITPEKGYDEAKVLAELVHLDQVKKGRHALVIVSEKLVDVHQLAQKISDLTSFAGRATILGHIQRGGSPVPEDRLLATRIGDKAVELLAEDKGGLCVGLIKDEIIATDIIEALDNPKSVKPDLYDVVERLS
ncbi:MAG: 6-phosphofructokinase [Erysipelotrichaceae bacterium]|nr:6-phosphofructokinase [Erysipelotrichaceae bacterium]